MTDDTKTAAERAREIADRTSGWSRKDVAELAITDTENRVRQESSALIAAAIKEAMHIARRAGADHVSDLIEGLLCADAQATLEGHVAEESKALIAAVYEDIATNHDQILEFGNCRCGQKLHDYYDQDITWDDHIRSLAKTDAKAALDRHVAAAVAKAREEWERDQPNTELLAARIVELEERCEQLEETAYDCESQSATSRSQPLSGEDGVGVARKS